MKLIIFFVCLIPTLYEAFSDRFGETKRDKVIDSILLIVVAIGIGAVSWCFRQNVLAVLLLILGWRVLTFDYITNLFLQEFSEGHKNINWFTFVGTTSFTDRIISKINPYVRLLLRSIIFGLSVWYFIR